MAGLIALLLAAGAAIWLLIRAARGGDSGDKRNITIFKAVIWLGLVAALFAAKLFPLAFMLLIAAGAITGIEVWRDKVIKNSGNTIPGAHAPEPANKQMTIEEAVSILGVSHDADESTVKAAHKSLISQLHPDKGGTDYLAAKINDARQLLLDQKNNTSDRGKNE